MTTTSEIPSVLQRIVATKHEEVAAAQAVLSLADLQAQAAAITTPRRGFANALRNADIGIIAEIKKASPSKGIINHNFAPAEFAAQYEAAGATCLSVLTDEQYFQGHDNYLREAKAACSLPALRKDFMVDVYQIYQSYVLGADCILLIMACLDDATALALHQVSIELGMDVLIETHTEEELLRALQLPHSVHNIYGINNRDLNTFAVDLQTSVTLKKVLLNAFTEDEAAPLLVTESGIHSADDIALMQSHGMHLFLIGEQFMKTDHPGNALQSLLASVSANR
ncbi:indole-3-glycerol phosphate synthase TrpC [Psychrobacter arenosus]|uniref:indole-3-glycerol phosphate synthase TrpC n=1 Tax=Psychrobacter arenosus TaxID=256326 RepID=UPI0019187D71|nr:indole-3-glycerol phosphate synthase TrpC [Psychrobacter arenosus]